MKLDFQFKEIQNSISLTTIEKIECLKELAEKAEKEGLTKLECKIFTSIGTYYRFEGNAFEGLRNCNKAYSILNERLPSSSMELAEIYREFCNIYANILEDYLTAIDYCFKGYQLDIPKLNTIFLNNIGSNYMNLKQYDNSLKYLAKAEELCKRDNALSPLAYVYHNIAEVYNRSGDSDKALEYYQFCLEATDKAYANTSENMDRQKIDYILCGNLNSIAETYIEQNKLSLAQESLSYVKAKAKETSQLTALSDAYMLEGKIMILQNELAEFENLCSKRINFCEKNSFFIDKEKWLKKSQEIYEDRKEFEKAIAVSKLIAKNRDEIKAKTNEANISNILINKEQEILELENRNRTIQIQKKELEQFAYIVTHDLKTPVSNISNFAGLFTRKFDHLVDEDGKLYLKYIIDNSIHLNEMLSDLLEYITVENMDEKVEDVDVESIIDFLVSNDILFRGRDDIQINYNNLPSVPIRKFHLESLLDNLIKNAIKFRREEEPVEIDITITENASEFHFKIADNGIGIEEAYKNSVFDIFKRLNKSKSGGTGVGLSICKKIVQSYAGNIWVEKNDPFGSIFHFTISK